MNKEIAHFTATVAVETMKFLAEKHEVSFHEIMVAIAEKNEKICSQFEDLIRLAQKTFAEA
jgi:hypothetical protein